MKRILGGPADPRKRCDCHWEATNGGELFISGAIKNTGSLIANAGTFIVEGTATGGGSVTITGEGKFEFGAATIDSSGGRDLELRWYALPSPWPLTATVTRKKVAGIEVASSRALVLWVRTTRSVPSSVVSPPFFYRFKAFMVGP